MTWNWVSFVVGAGTGIVADLLRRYLWHWIEIGLGAGERRRSLCQELESLLTAFGDSDTRDLPEAFRRLLSSIGSWKTRAFRSMPRGVQILRLCEEIEITITTDILSQGRRDEDISRDISAYLETWNRCVVIYELVCEDANVSPRRVRTRIELRHLERLRCGKTSMTIKGNCPLCAQPFSCSLTAELFDAREAVCDNCQQQFSIFEIPRE